MRTGFVLQTDSSHEWYSKSGMYIQQLIRKFSKTAFCQKIPLHFSHEFNEKNENKIMLSFCHLMIS